MKTLFALLLLIATVHGNIAFRTNRPVELRDSLPSPAPRWYDDQDEDEEEEEEVQIWLLPGPMPSAPMDGMPMGDFAVTRTRWET